MKNLLSILFLAIAGIYIIGCKKDNPEPGKYDVKSQLKSAEIVNASNRFCFEGNHWLVGAWLNTLILSHRAGIRACFPREKGGWESVPMLLIPSPLTSTEQNLVHLHTDFWEKHVLFCNIPNGQRDMHSSKS
jgi:hypothetical protein